MRKLKKNTEPTQHEARLYVEDLRCRLSFLEDELGRVVAAGDQNAMARFAWFRPPGGFDMQNIDIATYNLPCIGESEGAELLALRECLSKLERYTTGELIGDDYFEDYAVGLAVDSGAITHEDVWPNNCIDWVVATDDLKLDYTSVDIGQDIYWIKK